jgi:signal transduction histidine kinase
MNEIEDLKQELKQTQLAYQMAAQMSQFKAEFLARTSHELRSPLSSLIGLHQLILSDLCESPEEQKEFITQAYQSALKLMKLIDEIVAVAKTEYGSNKLDIESLQLTEIFENVYHLTHLQAANRSLKLNIIKPEPNITVLVDRERFVQSLVNLIDSSISLMKEGSISMEVAQMNADPDSISINIDIQCPADVWQAKDNSIATNSPNNPESIGELLQEIGLSPQMKLLLSQTLLETMGGDLKLIDLSKTNRQPLTRLLLTCKRA